MYLIDEEDLRLHEAERAFVPSLAEYFFYIVFSRVDRGKIIKLRVERVRIEFGERRLPAPRRPPSEEGEELFFFNVTAQGLAFSYEVLLAEEIPERFGPYP